MPRGVEPADPIVRPLDERPPDGADRWQPWTAIVALIAAFAGATILGGIVLAISGDIDDPPAGANIIATLLQDACFIGAAWLMASIASRPHPLQFGLRRPASIKASAGWIVVAYVAFLIFTALWLTALGKTDTEDDIVDQLGAGDSTAALLGVAFIVTVAAPLAEETLFRGYIFRALRNWRGVWPAAALTGLLFGLVHVAGSPIEFLLPLAFLGAALCLLYVRTGSLYPCIALHCLNNSVAFSSTQDWGAGAVGVFAGALAVITLVLWAVRSLTPPPGDGLPRSAA